MIFAAKYSSQSAVANLIGITQPIDFAILRSDHISPATPFPVPGSTPAAKYSAAKKKRVSETHAVRTLATL